MNRHEKPSGGEAKLHYLDGEFRVTRPGLYVLCAVTGAQIPLEDLRYWSVDWQEPYASPDAVMQRMLQRGE